MRRPRFTFWLMFCLAIMILFQGSGAISTRLQDNWLTSVILIVVSLFYNGRFGYFQESKKTIAYIKRITYQLLGVIVLLIGLSIELCFKLPTLVSCILIFIGACLASFLFFTGSLPLESNVDHDMDIS